MPGEYAASKARGLRDTACPVVDTVERQPRFKSLVFNEAGLAHLVHEIKQAGLAESPKEPAAISRIARSIRLK